jgi:glycosyltransferase involved in cell wall biosynthesis
MGVRVLCVGNMYPPHHLGGYELVWQGAVAYLRSSGHEVEVLTTDFRRDRVEDGGEPGVFRDLAWWWRDHEFPRVPVRGRLAVARCAHAALSERLAGPRPDTIAWWAMGGLPLSLLDAAHTVPSVAFVHDDWLLYGPQVDQWTRMFASRPRLARLAEGRTGVPTTAPLDAVRRWVFVSDFTRRRAADALPPGADTAVAHSGIDASFIGPGPEREWAWRLLYVGRIDERKGADVAVGALAHLPGDATLTVVGDGDEAHLAALSERATAFPGRVELRPGVERAQLPAVYDDHDAVLFPARWDEPWGLVPLEGMARGCPVVATGTGGSAEYLRDGENALLVPRGDAEALARAVQRLAGDEALRIRLRNAGLATAREHTDARFHATVLSELEALGP